MGGSLLPTHKARVPPGGILAAPRTQTQTSYSKNQYIHTPNSPAFFTPKPWACWEGSRGAASGRPENPNTCPPWHCVSIAPACGA